MSTYPKLSKNITADVAIIGGGLAGICAAYFLSRAGKKVAVLEAKTIGSGATSLTTAFITKVIDTDYSQLVKMFGPKKAKLTWKAGEEAINVIERTIKREKIDCGFIRCPNYIYANAEDDLKDLQAEYQAVKRAGFRAQLKKDNALHFKNSGYLVIPDQAKFNAEKFIQALAGQAKRNEALIFENTKVINVAGRGPIQLKTSGATVTAKKIIIATYDPLGNPKATHFKKGMYKSYLFKLRIPKNKFPEAIYEDTNNPYHYFRVDRSGRYDSMTIGGEDHRKELKMNPGKNYKALEEYIRETFPRLQYKIKSRWSGPILEPSDGLPLIGEYEPNRFVTCAFSGNGMTYSIISAVLLSDLILGKKSKWAKLYDPKRKPSLKQLTEKFKDYAGVFFGAAAKNIFK